MLHKLNSYVQCGNATRGIFSTIHQTQLHYPAKFDYVADVSSLFFSTVLTKFAFSFIYLFIYLFSLSVWLAFLFHLWLLELWFQRFVASFGCLLPNSVK